MTLIRRTHIVRIERGLSKSGQTQVPRPEGSQ